MDKLLYPYISEIQVELLSKNKIKNTTSLVLTDSLYIPSPASNIRDEYYLNGELIEEIYVKNNKTYHTIDLKEDSGHYTMTINETLRKKNMAYYLAEKLLIILFSKLYSIDLVKKDGDKLIFSKADYIRLDEMVQSIENLINHIIRSGLDVRTGYSNDKLYVKIPSVGASQISYPVPANTAELLGFKLFSHIGDHVEISFICQDDFIADYRQMKETFTDINILLDQYEAEATINQVIEENIEMKAKIKDLRDLAYSSYLEPLKPTFETKGLTYLAHKVRNDKISELSALVSMVQTDMALIAKDEGQYSSFIIGNKTGVSIRPLVEKLQTIYSIDLFQDESYIRGRIESKYLDRFMETLSKDLYEYMKISIH